MSALDVRKTISIVAVTGVGLALLLLVVGLPWRIGTVGAPNPRSPTVGTAEAAAVPPLPSPEPLLTKPLPQELARAANYEIPVTKGGLEPAPPFDAAKNLGSPIDHRAALDCLTSAIYYEAGSESVRGQRAVAQVVLNRVRHPAFPATVCGVVFQGSQRKSGCQFTFTCDGSLQRRADRSGWGRAREVAAAALAGAVEPSVGMATHYHTDWVFPYWAESLDKVAVVGSHLFYRWEGYWGRRPAFSQRYRGENTVDMAGGETMPSGLVDLTANHRPSPSRPHRDAASAPIEADELFRAPAADDSGSELLADESGSQLIVDEQTLRP